jgi:hypothetical protein
MMRTIDEACAEYEVEFLAADGLARLDALFEEEFRVDEDKSRIVAGSADCVMTCCSWSARIPVRRVTTHPLRGRCSGRG